MSKRLRRMLIFGAAYLAVVAVSITLGLDRGHAAALQQSIDGDVSIGCPSGCSAVTNNPTSYYQIDLPQTSQKTSTVNITISYSPCVSYMGFDLGVNPSPNLINNPTACAAGPGSKHNSQSKSFSMVTGSGCSLDGSTNYCKAYIYVSASPPNNSVTGHFAYVLSVNGGAVIGVAPNQNPTSNPAGSANWPGGAWQFGSFASDPSWTFAPPCDISSETVYVAWQGVNYGDSFQQQNVSWSLTDNGNPVASMSNGELDNYQPNSNNVFSYAFNVQAGHSYTWSWQGISGNNEVVYSIPFSTDSFNVGQQCGWSLSGNTTISNITNSSATFDHYVSNDINSPMAANFDWRVVYSNNPNLPANQWSPTNIYGTISGAQPGKPLPQIATASQNTYTFPSNASNNEQYCQRIRFTNANGPGTSDGYSLPQCFSNKSAPPSPTVTATCTSAYAYTTQTEPFTLPYSDQLPSSPPPQGFWDNVRNQQTSPLLTQTWVKVTNVTASPYAFGTAGYGQQSDTLNLSYTPAKPYITVQAVYLQYDYYRYKQSNGTWTDKQSWAQYNGGNYVTPKNIPCYSASCNVTSVTGTGPGGIVLAGQQFTVTGTVTNTSPSGLALPQYLGGNGLSITDMSNGGPHYLGSGIPPPSASLPFSYTGTAPSNIQNVTVQPYPDYYGTDPIGTYCSGPTTFPVYEKFDLQPSASFASNTNWENPTPSITYNTAVTQISGPSAPVSINGTVTKNGVVLPPTVSANGNYGNFNQNTTVSNPTTELGDNYCDSTTISITGVSPATANQDATGYLGPGNSVVDGQDGLSSTCHLNYNEPYVHFFGSDVWSGGGFDSTQCVPPSGTGGIDTESSTNGTGSSGTQFGAEALQVIEGFGSASLRGSPPSSPFGLTFSNTSANAGSGNYGGNFDTTLSSSVNCVSDYNQATGGLTPNNVASSTDLSGSSPALFKPPSGTLTIDGGSPGAGISIGNGSNVTIYVEGNVYIDGNISFANTNWGSVKNIPSLYIVALGTSSSNSGNIYISPTVTSLDGVYIAQPGTGSNSGTIDTCAGNGMSYNVSQLISNQCSSQLTVNGSFTAQNIKLDRTFSSLRYGVPHESSQTPVHSCGTIGTDVNSSYGTVGQPLMRSDCAAEIFNYSPEQLLAQPNIPYSTGPTTGKFDTVTSLPPVL